MSRPGSERNRRRWLGRLLLAGYLAVAPSTVPPWRLEPVGRSAAMLVVGEPTRGLWRGGQR